MSRKKNFCWGKIKCNVLPIVYVSLHTTKALKNFHSSIYPPTKVIAAATTPVSNVPVWRKPAAAAARRRAAEQAYYVCFSRTLYHNNCMKLQAYETASKVNEEKFNPSAIYLSHKIQTWQLIYQQKDFLRTKIVKYPFFAAHGHTTPINIYLTKMFFSSQVKGLL